MAVGGPCPDVLGSLRNERKHLTVLAKLAWPRLRKKVVNSLIYPSGVRKQLPPNGVTTFILNGRDPTVLVYCMLADATGNCSEIGVMSSPHAHEIWASAVRQRRLQREAKTRVGANLKSLQEVGITLCNSRVLQ